jgi:hypothetical protein
MIGRTKNNIIPILQEIQQRISKGNYLHNTTNLKILYRTAKNIVYALWPVFLIFYMIHNLLAYKMNIDILLLTETFNKTKLIAEEYYNG